MRKRWKWGLGSCDQLCAVCFHWSPLVKEVYEHPSSWRGYSQESLMELLPLKAWGGKSFWGTRAAYLLEKDWFLLVLRKELLSVENITRNQQWIPQEAIRHNWISANYFICNYTRSSSLPSPPLRKITTPSEISCKECHKMLLAWPQKQAGSMHSHRQYLLLPGSLFLLCCAELCSSPTAGTS